MNPHTFVAIWRGNTNTEQQTAQQFFLDLCALVGVQPPQQADPKGEWFKFEAGADKAGGGKGRADVWRRGCFAIEFKGPDGDLAKAYGQLVNYAGALENPPLLITSDTQKLVIYPNFTGLPNTPREVTLDDMLTAEGLAAVRHLFTDPEAFKPNKSAEQVTEQAATEFARLADHLRAQGHAPHAVAHTLIRLLFVLFAEDIALIPRGLFAQMVSSGRADPKRFNNRLRTLFECMAVGEDFGLESIPHINGGLFNEGEPPLEMDAAALAILHGVTSLDWMAIEPSILGTLFTRGLDPSKRAQLGAHYTSKSDILLIVEPVLMAPLRREWEQLRAQAPLLAAQRDAAPNKAARNRAHAEIEALFRAFWHKLAGTRVLDPACGSGNFLYVSLRQLLELWKETSLVAAECGLPYASPLEGESPSPVQLFGIEKDDYAHELAQATVWIGYLQWLHANGYGFPSEPILKQLDNIRHMDAILAFDAAGKPVEPEWPEADVIVGNPPFLGTKKLRRELGSDYVDALFRLYGGRIPNFSDLSCYWLERARAQVEEVTRIRVGLLATNSVRGGENRTVLERILDTGSIFMAWSDRPWVLEGAAVRVAMIGFDDGTEGDFVLDGVRVGVINPDLTSVTNVTIANSLNENMNLAYIGDVKGASFDINAQTAEGLISALNLSEVSNAEVIRPWINAIDITRRPRNMWIIDFPPDMSEQVAARYEAPFGYVSRMVYPSRQKMREQRTAARWWVHTRPCEGMRAATADLSRFIVTPTVSKFRLFSWAAHPTLPDHQLAVFARADDYFFGVLHAKPHELWALRLGTSLEDRPRYTPTTTFETYPFPWPPGQEAQDDPRVQAIAQAARELVAWRDGWLNPPGLPATELKKRTLTGLYNRLAAGHEPDLAALHAALDRAVFTAYGWPDTLRDEEVLERLLALNLARAAK